MSTLRLLTNTKHGKKGDTVTVPFLEARDLVAAGVAERPGDAGRPEAPTTVSTETYEKAGKRVKEVEAELAAVAEERDELAAAGKRLGERVSKLEAENKALSEQVANLKKAAGK